MQEDAIERVKDTLRVLQTATGAFVTSVVAALFSSIATMFSIDFFLVDGMILLALVCAVALTMMCFGDSDDSSLKGLTVVSFVLLVWSLCWATLIIFSPQPISYFVIWLLTLFAAFYSRKLVVMFYERHKDAIRAANQD